MKEQQGVSFLEYFDILGHEFNFTIRNYTHHKTKFGGVITIFFTLNLLIHAYYFVQYIQYRREPKLMKESKKLNFYPIY